MLLIWFLIIFVVLMIILLFYKRNAAKNNINIIFPNTDNFNRKTLKWEDIKYNINKDGELYLSIIIPAFNEEKRIVKTMNSIIDYMENRSKLDIRFSYEIIVVDDGSRDDTLKVCRELWLRRKKTDKILGGKLLLLSCLENKGKGNAVKIGVLSCLGKYILMLDADGATNINCFSRLEDLCNKDDEFSIIFGSRNISDINNDTEIVRKWYRQLLNVLFHKITSIIVNTDLNDTQCGFKLFSRRSAQVIFPSLRIKRWAFDIEIVIIAKILGLKIQATAVDWKEIQGSKLSIFSDSIKMLLDIIAVRILYFIRMWQVLDNKEDIIKKID